MQYKPGEAFLQCPYCQFKNAIAVRSAAATGAHVREQDFWECSFLYQMGHSNR